MSDWHRKVYKKKEPEVLFNSDVWKKTRERVLRRDKYLCLRCDRKFDSANLSAHHMVPRAEGGGDNLENLVTLCNECHDYVEMHNLQNKAEIMGSYESATCTNPIAEDVPSDNHPDGYYQKDGESFIRPEWHKWVYGGMKHEKQVKQH